MMSPTIICRAWARALNNSAMLRDWCERSFGQPMRFQIGLDVRKPFTVADAPFCVLLPDQAQESSHEFIKMHQIGLIVGLADSEVAQYSWGQGLSGLEKLDTEVWPMIRAVICAMPQYRPQAWVVDYIIETYPLLQLSITATIAEPRPLGADFARTRCGRDLSAIQHSHQLCAQKPLAVRSLDPAMSTRLPGRFYWLLSDNLKAKSLKLIARSQQSCGIAVWHRSKRPYLGIVLIFSPYFPEEPAKLILGWNQLGVHYKTARKSVPIGILIFVGGIINYSSPIFRLFGNQHGIAVLMIIPFRPCPWQSHVAGGVQRLQTRTAGRLFPKAAPAKLPADAAAQWGRGGKAGR